MKWKNELKDFIKTEKTIRFKKVSLGDKQKIVQESLKDIEKELKKYHKSESINVWLSSSNIIEFDYGGVNELRYIVDISNSEILITMFNKKGTQIVNKKFLVTEINESLKEFILNTFTVDFVSFFKTK
jgi:hypothetical protein